MAGTGNSEEPLCKLRLFVDKKRNKVVLAEAGKDLVDVLFSFLTLPMGAIVRLLKEYQQNEKSQATTTIGCFNNLHFSLLGMPVANFMTEACKQMLLYPRSVNEKQRRLLKLDIDDAEPLKYYRCPNLLNESSCPHVYSNICTSRCSCGALMGIECERHEGDEISVNDATSLFIITDDMKVGFTTIGLTLNILKGLGYKNVGELQTMLVDVNPKEVLTLLDCLFSSETPLTDVFLRKNSPCSSTRPQNTATLSVQEENGVEEESSNVITVKVFTRKQDGKVLYVESGKDFVDLLLTFLVLPLKSVWEISGRNSKLGCVGNLYESFKSLSVSSEGTNVSASTCMLPWYYSCQPKLLDVCYKECDRARSLMLGESLHLKPMDPRCGSCVEQTMNCGGFVKRGTSFLVSDDLIITPMNLTTTVFALKMWEIDLDDIEKHVISISEAEATRLLRASLLTSTALTTALSSLLSPKKPKEKNSKASMSLFLGRLVFNWFNFRFFL